MYDRDNGYVAPLNDSDSFRMMTGQFRGFCWRWLPCVLLLLSHAGRGQDRFKTLTTNNGLAHNTVMALLQDHKGFLWLGTADGLSRYNGQTFDVFRRAARDTHSLSSNYVNCLLEDRQHRLWVGTNFGGLCQLDASGVRFVRYVRTVDGRDISTMAITGLAQDGAGRIWAGTNGNGLLQIDPRSGQVRQLTLQNAGLPTNFIHHLFLDRLGNLWSGNRQGHLFKIRLADRHVTKLVLPPSPDSSPHSIMTIRGDRRGRVWVGTKRSGLFRADAGQTTFRQVYYKPGIKEGVNDARSLYEDKAGHFWLGTDDGVVLARDADFRQTQHWSHRPGKTGSLSTHATVCVQGDRDGNLWIGTWEGGLNVLFAQPDPFELYEQHGEPLPGLSDKAVTAVAADSVGNVWIGSTQGLAYVDRQRHTYRHFGHRPGTPATLPANDVTGLHLLSENCLLVSLWNHGTVLFSPNLGRVLRPLPMLGTDEVYVIRPLVGQYARVVSKRGASWHINRYTGEVSVADSIPLVSESVRTLLTTADGTLWGGTFGNGLLGWQKNGAVTHFTGLRQPGSLYDEYLTCLLEDRQHRLWVGTMNGLHRYERQKGRFALITSENGLPNEAIMSITQDKTGLLWVATNNGLSSVNEAGRVVQTYRREDGLAGNDFTERAVSQSPDGTLFWGGKHGLTVLRSRPQQPTPPAVPVYLTGLKLFNRPVLPGRATDAAAADGSTHSPLTRSISDTKAITLHYSQSVITFDFAAVLFRAFRNVRYAYRLDGFETGWNYVGAQHSATYTNQNPGTYRFRVKASLTDDFTNAPETVLELAILPPWYRTGWAYGLYALVLVGLLLGMRRVIQIREGYKTELRAEHLEAEKARELDRLRSGFFTNISHEFRTPLTLILTPLEQFLTDRAPDSRRAQFKTMHQNANRLLRLINELLDLSKLESDTLRPAISRQNVVALVQQVAAPFEEQAGRQGITLVVDTDLVEHNAWFDPGIVEKVLYNLLANALKFTASGGSVTLRCRILPPDHAPELLLEVDDTGIGIAPEHAAHIFERFYQVGGQQHTKKAGTGIGLALTRELVELHRGQIRVESQPGVGTVFIATLPVHASAFPAAWRSTATSPADVDTADLYASADAATLPPARPVSADVPLVLVVEDHDDLREYVAGCFGQRYRVLTATNGREALAVAQQEIPDLIISDWLMPDMDGVQLCQTLKQDERTSHVPLILLTSRSSTESKLEGLGVGADDYVTKPFNLDVLLSRAANLMENRRLLRAKYSRVLTLPPTPAVAESAEEAFLRRATTFIDRHLADADLNVERLERELGLSSTQLLRKLKALTGKGGNELIRHVRLQRAAQLLRVGNSSVAEVAYAVGFNDPNYFTRAFRKEFGVSPGEWAKQIVGV